MKLEDMRGYMESVRRAAESEAELLKDSQLVLDRLRSVYGELDGEDRLRADQVIGEWLLSDDQGYRFDALVLVDSFRIKGTMPALMQLIQKLATVATPGAPYELKTVRRIICRLVEKPRAEVQPSEMGRDSKQ